MFFYEVDTLICAASGDKAQSSDKAWRNGRSRMVNVRHS